LQILKFEGEAAPKEEAGKESAPKSKVVPLVELGDLYKQSLKAIPCSKRHKVIESTVYAMENGVKAGYSIVKWKAGNFGLLTYFVGVYKNNKLITVTCTGAPGMPPDEIMEGWVKALKVNK